MSQPVSRIDIPLDAEVRCLDGSCGQSVAVVFNPIARKVTHFVLETKEPHRIQYLVPVDDITHSTHHQIDLSCRRDDLSQYRLFKRVEYRTVTEAETPFIPDLYEGTAFVWPFSQPAVDVVPVGVESVPAHELAIHRGAHVEATDGRVGIVDELIVNPQDEQITHLVLREGHLWGKKEVSIPVTAVDHILDDTVFLTIDQDAVGALPTVPTRHW